MLNYYIYRKMKEEELLKEMRKQGEKMNQKIVSCEICAEEVKVK